MQNMRTDFFIYVYIFYIQTNMNEIETMGIKYFYYFISTSIEAERLNYEWTVKKGSSYRDHSRKQENTVMVQSLMI